MERFQVSQTTTAVPMTWMPTDPNIATAWGDVGFSALKVVV
jgi:hypothetical protein